MKSKTCTWHIFLYEYCMLIWLRQHLIYCVTLFTPDTFSLGANTWQRDCCPRSPLEHKPQVKTYICTELWWNLIEILSVWDKYSEKSGVSGNRDLIIVSGVIITRACENTHRIFFSCATNHLHLLCEGFSRTRWRVDMIGVWIIFLCNSQTGIFFCSTAKGENLVMDTPPWFAQNLSLGVNIYSVLISITAGCDCKITSDNIILKN